MGRAFGCVIAFAYGAVSRISKLAGVIVISAGMAKAETVTIAALGDSLTAGYGLAQDEGFVPQLEGWLQDAGADVSLMNAGVSGDTTAGGLSRVGWTLTPEVDAMIVALGGNDYLRGIDPAVSRANLDGILAAGQEAGVAMLLVGLSVGSNYGAGYKQEFEGMYADLAEKYDVPLYPDFAAGLRAGSGMQDGMLEFMQADGIHPNAEGVSVIVAAMGPTVLDLVQAVD
ncbi:MAG: arylesterase [Yoonia sp.]|uniref:arylesterase n=1 Tax=Yoonia sp. TaxID=2212373 RepID=UPI003EF436F2